MALAADRDLIARQYANGFREVFDDGVPAMLQGIGTHGLAGRGDHLMHICICWRVIPTR